MVTSAIIDLHCRGNETQLLGMCRRSRHLDLRSLLEVSQIVHISPALTTNGCESRLPKRFRPCQTPALMKKVTALPPAHHHNYTIHQRGWDVRLRSWLTIYFIYICLCTYIPIFRCSLFVTPAQHMLCNIFSFQHQLKPRP